MPDDPVWEIDTAPLEQEGFCGRRELPEKAKRLLADGWEPFAVSEARLWFRLKSA